MKGSAKFVPGYFASRMLACALACAISPRIAFADPVTLVQPSDGAIVHPGQNVSFKFQVDPALPSGSVTVVMRCPSDDSASMRSISGPPFEGTILIPDYCTGPVKFLVMYSKDGGGAARGPSLTLMSTPPDAPISISATESMDFQPPQYGIAPQQVEVKGKYLNGSQRNLSGSALGTTYSSTNTSIATVDSEGVVSSVANGYAFIISQNAGLRAYTEVIVYPPGNTSQAGTIEQTSNVSIVAEGFRHEVDTNFYAQPVTIRNTSTSPLPGPFSLLVTGLPAGVELSDSEVTKVVNPIGTPYLGRIQSTKDFLAPGESLTVTLNFFDHQDVPINYTLRFFTGHAL